MGCGETYSQREIITVQGLDSVMVKRNSVMKNIYQPALIGEGSAPNFYDVNTSILATFKLQT